MQSTHRKIILTAWVAVLILVLSHPGILAAQPLSGTATWRYNTFDNGQEDFWLFDELYNLTLTKELTAAANLNSTVRYNQYHSDNGARDGSNLSPSVSLDLRNDLFFLNLGANFSWYDYKNQPSRNFKGWNLNWFSQWEERWPVLRLYYNESFQQDDLNPHKQDISSTQMGSTLSWKYWIMEYLYNYNRTSNKDKVKEVTTNADHHYGMLKLAESWSFWQQKLVIDVGQRFSYDYANYETRVSGGGDFFFKALEQEGFHGLDSSPEQGELEKNTALTDNQLQESAGIEISSPTEMHNIAVHADGQVVNKIRIYFDRELLLSEQQGLAWQTYESEDGRNWQLITGLPTITYKLDSLLLQTMAIIDFPTLQHEYVKIVLSLSGFLIKTLRVTELEAGESRFINGKEVTDSQFTKSDSALNLTLRPLERWTLNNKFSYRDYRYDPGNNEININASLSSDYYLNRYFWFTLGFDEHYIREEDQDNEIDRYYTAVIKSSPLDSIDISLGLTRNKEYTNHKLMKTRDDLNGYLTARIYPDITTSLLTNWTDDDEYGSTFRWRLGTTMRLNRKVHMDVYYDDDSTAIYYGFLVNYRPSDILSISSQIDRQQTDERTSLHSNLAWLCSPTIRTTAGYLFDTSPDNSSHKLDFSLSWIPCQLLNFRFNAGYKVSQENDDMFNWMLQCNVRY